MSENKESKLLRFAYYAVPILLVVYVLSIGPVYAVAANSFLNSFIESKPNDEIVNLESFESLYAPLLVIGNKNQFLDEVLSDYKRYCLKTMYPGYFSGGCGYSRGYSY